MKRSFNKLEFAAIILLLCLGWYLWHQLHSDQEPLRPWDISTLGLAIELYRESGQERLPPDFQTLVKAGFLNEQRAKRIERELDFLMANRPREELTPNTVVAAERPNREKSMCMVLLLDGTGLSVWSDQLSSAIGDRSGTIVLVSEPSGQPKLERRQVRSKEATNHP